MKREMHAAIGLGILLALVASARCALGGRPEWFAQAVYLTSAEAIMMLGVWWVIAWALWNAVENRFVRGGLLAFSAGLSLYTAFALNAAAFFDLFEAERQTFHLIELFFPFHLAFWATAAVLVYVFMLWGYRAVRALVRWISSAVGGDGGSAAT